jgi:hypothetical protein
VTITCTKNYISNMYQIYTYAYAFICIYKYIFKTHMIVPHSIYDIHHIMTLQLTLNILFPFRLIRIIKEIGGIYTSKINSEVFCILARKVGSPRHTQAMNLNIPVIEIQWLFDCRSKNERLELGKYMIKCFLGLVMSGCVIFYTLLMLLLLKIIFHGYDYCCWIYSYDHYE